MYVTRVYSVEQELSPHIFPTLLLDFSDIAEVCESHAYSLYRLNTQAF